MDGQKKIVLTLSGEEILFEWALIVLGRRHSPRTGLQIRCKILLIVTMGRLWTVVLSLGPGKRKSARLLLIVGTGYTVKSRSDSVWILEYHKVAVEQYGFTGVDTTRN